MRIGTQDRVPGSLLRPSWHSPSPGGSPDTGVGRASSGTRWQRPSFRRRAGVSGRVTPSAPECRLSPACPWPGLQDPDRPFFCASKIAEIYINGSKF